ncbi:uncharacterized protein [Rutidosis leptorrhynchoides]|uniref:uncharacterized protein n=1 Tax=Rutidosis leptorrhynchoides TaxID=125765 RepID=UPI003A9A61C3
MAGSHQKSYADVKRRDLEFQVGDKIMLKVSPWKGVVRFEIQVDSKLHLMEEPVEIMDRKVEGLKQSNIPIVKVWRNARRGPEFTWECEVQMKQKYLQLFLEETTPADVH